MFKSGLSRKSNLAQAVRYALSHWDGLTRFLDDGRIEIDSNAVERSIRPIALNRKRYEKGTALVAAYSPRLKRIGIQNWRRASTVAGMSRQAFDAQRGVAKGIAGRPASSTQWNRIGRSR